MKKTYWSIVLLACIATANAQDTIFSTNLQENYYDFGKKWPTTWEKGSYAHGMGRYSYHLMQYNVKKPTKVYGVAAVVGSQQTLDASEYIDWGDTIKSQYVCEYGIETYAVFECSPTSDQKPLYFGPMFGKDPITSIKAPIYLYSDTVQVNEWADPPTAYFCFDDTLANRLHMEWFGYDKLFEVYLDEPVTVDDSFYVGRSGRGIYYNLTRKEYWYSEYAKLYYCTSPQNVKIVSYHDEDYFWYFKTLNDQHPFLFPILTPKPDPVDTTSNVDTTIVDTTIVDTTLRIDHKGFLQRYVSVQPNPASTSTTILSSFSILGIDAYATNGELVQHWEGEGLTTTLDVGTLPKGVYVLRITTAIGNVNKRLVVQ